MNTEMLVISQARLVSLIGGLGYPNPDDDRPIWKWPHGPGPVAQTWLNVLDRIAINPQPLPPKELLATAFAGAVVERAARFSELSSLLPDQSRALGATFGSELEEFDGQCGTMSRWELLQKLLAWLKQHNPPPPPPEPFWKDKLSQNEIIIVGGRIAHAAHDFGNSATRAGLQSVGVRLIQQGLKTGQAMASAAYAPASERV